MLIGFKVRMVAQLHSNHLSALGCKLFASNKWMYFPGVDADLIGREPMYYYVSFLGLTQYEVSESHATIRGPLLCCERLNFVINAENPNGCSYSLKMLFTYKG